MAEARKKDLLLVIDMQNVYAEGGQWYCPGVDEAALRIKRLIQQKDEDDLDVIFTQFLAPEDPVGVWKQYNQENAEVNADIYANQVLEVFQEDIRKYPLYSKSVYSSMVIPQLQEAVKGVDHVLVSGVVAECCVLATAMALIDAGCSVIYLTDGVAGLNREMEEAVEKVISGLEPLHVRRLTVDDYLLGK